MLEVSPTRPGEPVTITATWRFESVDDIRRVETHPDFDLDGDGLFETEATTKTQFSDSVSHAFPSPGTIRIAHFLRAEPDTFILPIPENSAVYRNVEIPADGPTNQPPPNTANEPPVALLTASPNPVSQSGSVTLDGSGSSDPDGTIAKFEFDLDNNGTFEIDNGASPAFVWQPISSSFYSGPGNYEVGLRVTDDRGGTATDTQIVMVTSPRPRMALDVAQSAVLQRGVTIELRPTGHEVRAGRFLLNGNELLNIGNTAKGKMSAGPFPERFRSKGKKIRWATRSNIKTNVDTQRTVNRGVALLEFPAGGLACLGFKLVSREDKPAKGRFRILGARGKARRLRGNGIGRVITRPDSLTLRGRGGLRFGKPWRTLGGFGCGKLRRL